MDFFKDKIVFPEMLKLLLLSFAWLGNSGMCVLVGGGRAVNDVCTKMTNHIEFLSVRVISPLLYQPVLGLVDEFA